MVSIKDGSAPKKGRGTLNSAFLVVQQEMVMKRTPHKISELIKAKNEKSRD